MAISFRGYWRSRLWKRALLLVFPLLFIPLLKAEVAPTDKSQEPPSTTEQQFKIINKHASILP